MVAALAPAPPGVDTDAWAGLCARVRAECGWHIAPSIVETVTVAGRGNDRVVVDTLALTAVSDVSVNGLDVASPLFTPWGTIYPDASSWPGFGSGLWWGNVTLTITHGYPSCPEDLLAALTSAARSLRPAGVPTGKLQAGPFAAEFSDDLPSPLLDAIDRYSLPSRA